MGRIIAVANQKGGVGKTTTAVNLSAALAISEKKVLLIDIDPQGNASSGIGIEKDKLKQCIYDVLINDYSMKNIIIKTDTPNLMLAPATLQLTGAEVEMVPVVSRETKLKKAVELVKSEYDYLIIDCPPSLGLLTVNALTAADSVLVTIQTEYYALEGVGRLMNTINLVKKHLNKNLRVEGVLLTMYDARTNLSLQVTQEVKDFFKDMVFKSVIPRNVRLSEAPSHGLAIFDYDGKCKGSEQYMELAAEVINR